MDDGAVRQVRRFNRTVTQRVGALNDHFLRRDRPLGEARLLWEIGEEGCEVRALRSRLDLDSGQASRVLRALEADGLVEVPPTPADRRVPFAALTRAGRRERRLRDHRAEEVAASILEPLDAARRKRLVEAMGTVEQLLTSSAVELRVVDPESADARQ